MTDFTLQSLNDPQWTEIRDDSAPLAPLALPALPSLDPLDFPNTPSSSWTPSSSRSTPVPSPLQSFHTYRKHTFLNKLKLGARQVDLNQDSTQLQQLKPADWELLHRYDQLIENKRQIAKEEKELKLQVTKLMRDCFPKGMTSRSGARVFVAKPVERRQPCTQMHVFQMIGEFMLKHKFLATEEDARKFAQNLCCYIYDNLPTRWVGSKLRCWAPVKRKKPQDEEEESQAQKEKDEFYHQKWQAKCDATDDNDVEPTSPIRKKRVNKHGMEFPSIHDLEAAAHMERASI